jgi:hypothetical protein
MSKLETVEIVEKLWVGCLLESVGLVDMSSQKKLSSTNIGRIYRICRKKEQHMLIKQHLLAYIIYLWKKFPHLDKLVC